MRLVTSFASAALAFSTLLSTTAFGDERVWHTTTSLIGKSKYDSGFKHYDYVNPDAPKGGTLNATVSGTYDSFNPFIVKGSPAAGFATFGGLLWDTLMEQGVDEPSTSHPLIAEAYTYPADYSSATYRIDKRARWHDGTPITVEDVKWSMEKLKENSPDLNNYYKNVKEVVIDNDREVTFIFDQKNNQELPHIIGDLPILPKLWWEGTNAKGEKRDVSAPTLEPPLGSAPYKISKFEAGSSIQWERVKDYWAKDTPTRKGRYNVDVRNYIYFKDQAAKWEAFKKGHYDDIRDEHRAEFWARRYIFPAFKNGDVKKRSFEKTSGYPMQGWALNMRRPQFQDRRVRQALTIAFNFENMSKTLFFGQYERVQSYFGGTELQSKSLPKGRELEILTEYKDKLPNEIFTEPFSLPVYENRGDERKFLKASFDLLKEAGWERKGSKLVNVKTGEPFKLEIMGHSPASEKSNAPWLNSLKRLGIEATFRVVDSSQYLARITSFDYDVFSMPYTWMTQSLLPGNEQRSYWTSKAADQKGSRNFAGIKNPVIDDLVERMIFAKNRAELVAMTNALDRILLFGYYNVPQWYVSTERIAYWDKFGIPEKQPSYPGYDPESWWIIPEKEAALKAKYK